MARKDIRLKEYDYSTNGYYFVTICSENNENIFGHIENDNCILNDCCDLVKIVLLNLNNVFDNIQIDESYVIMPNHIHFILIIDNQISENTNVVRYKKIEIKYMEMQFELSSQLKYPKLGDVLGFFKFQTTKLLNIYFDTPKRKIWQRSYYEHVIRNEKSLFEIRKYIINNPLKWSIDEYNKNK